MSTVRRSPEQIIEHLEGLVTTPNLGRELAADQQKTFVEGINRIAGEVFQLHTEAQLNRSLLRVDIALTQLRNASAGTTDERMKALVALRSALASTPARANAATTSITQDVVQGFRGETAILTDSIAKGRVDARAALLLGGSAALGVAGIAGGIMAVRSFFKQRNANEQPKPWYKRLGKALILPLSIAGIFVLGAMGRTPQEQREAAARKLIGPGVDAGDIAGVRFERRTLPDARAPETFIVHNGVPYRFLLRWPPAAATGTAPAPAVREDNWSANLSTIVDRGARTNGGVGITFPSGFGPFGGQSETRVELGGLLQIAGGMPLSTDPNPPNEITRTVFLRFNLATLGPDQRAFIQEQVRVGAPVVVEGSEVRVQATVVLRRAGAPTGVTAAPSEYPNIPATPLDVRAGEQTVNLGTDDPASISLSVPGQGLVTVTMPATGGTPVTSGAITLTRAGGTLTVRQSDPPPAVAPTGPAVLSIQRSREPGPRSISVRFGPAGVEAPIKDDRVTIDPSTRRFQQDFGFPNAPLTMGNGTASVAVQPGATRTPVGKFLISRGFDGSSMTVEPANATLALADEPLTIAGGSISRTIQFTFTPEAVRPALTLPSPLTLTSTDRQHVLNGVPNVRLTVGTRTLEPTVDASVTVGNVKISRSNSGTRLTIEPNNADQRIADEPLVITGDGVNLSTRVAYAPLVPEIPAFGDIVIPSDTRMYTVTGLPARALTVREGTNAVQTIGVAETKESGNLRFTRISPGTTMTIQVEDRDTNIDPAIPLTIGGDGLTERAGTVRYVKEVAPAAFTLPAAEFTFNATTNQSQVIENGPTVALRTAAVTTPVAIPATDIPLETTAPDHVVVGSLRIKRSNGGRRIEIERVGTGAVNQSLTLTGAGGINTTARYRFMPETAPAPTEIPLNAAITLAGTPPTYEATGLPTAAMTVKLDSGAEQPLAASGTVTIGGMSIVRSNGGATMTFTAASAYRNVNAALTFGGTGLANRATTVRFTPAAYPLAATTALTGAPPSATLTGLPATETVTVGSASFPIDDQTERNVGGVKIKRSADNRSLSVTVIDDANRVNEPLRVRFGDVEANTTATFTPALRAIDPVTIDATLFEDITIPAGRLTVAGRELARGGTMRISNTGAALDATSAEGILQVSRIEDTKVRFTAIAAASFTNVQVAIQRNGDAAARNVSFSYNAS